MGVQPIACRPIFHEENQLFFHHDFLSPALATQMNLWALPALGPAMTPGARATPGAPKAFGWAGQNPFSGAEHRDTAGKPGQLASGRRPSHKNAGSGHCRAEGMAVPNKVIVPKNAHIPKTQAEPGPRLPELEAGEGVVGDRKRNCVSRKGREMFGRSKVCNAHHVTSHILSPFSSGLQTPPFSPCPPAQ